MLFLSTLWSVPGDKLFKEMESNSGEKKICLLRVKHRAAEFYTERDEVSVENPELFSFYFLILLSFFSCLFNLTSKDLAEIA